MLLQDNIDVKLDAREAGRARRALQLHVGEWVVRRCTACMPKPLNVRRLLGDYKFIASVQKPELLTNRSRIHGLQWAWAASSSFKDVGTTLPGVGVVVPATFLVPGLR